MIHIWVLVLGRGRGNIGVMSGGVKRGKNAFKVEVILREKSVLSMLRGG